MRYGDYMVKADFKNGFLQLPIRECEQTFVGFKHPFNNSYCVFTRLPFGLGPATFLFQTFSACLRQYFATVLNWNVAVYIDDWLFTQSSEDTANLNLKQFADICNHLGIAMNHEKTEGPLQEMPFLGLIINSINCTLTLPEEKRSRYATEIAVLLASKSPKMSELAQTAGRLVHVAAVHTSGWANVQPLWDALYQNSTEWTKRQLRQTNLLIEPELWTCLSWWLQQLQHPLSRRIWRLLDNRLQLWEALTAATDTAGATTISTDACITGWGAATNFLTISGLWSQHQQSLSNNWRETQVIVYAITRWPFITNTRVLVLTDNSTTVAVINLRRPAAIGLQLLAANLTRLEKGRQIQLVGLHIPGILNDLPDALSRNMPTWQAKPLALDLAPVLTLIKPTVVLGIVGTPPIPRYTPMPIPVNGFVSAVTTPDIPYLIRLLASWASVQPGLVGWILIPQPPAAWLPIPGSRLLSVLPPIHPEAPNLSWLLLEWSAAELNC